MTDKLVKKCLLTELELSKALQDGNAMWASGDNDDINGKAGIPLAQCHDKAIQRKLLAKAIPIIAEEIKRKLEEQFQFKAGCFSKSFLTEGDLDIRKKSWHTFWERYKGGE